MLITHKLSLILFIYNIKLLQFFEEMNYKNYIKYLI